MAGNRTSRPPVFRASCYVAGGGQLGRGTGRGWRGMLTRFQEPWVSLLGVYGKRIWIWWIERGKKRGWVNPHDARKRIAPKESKVLGSFTPLASMDDNRSNGLLLDGHAKSKELIVCIGTVHTEHLATSHNCRRRT